MNSNPTASGAKNCPNQRTVGSPAVWEHMDEGEGGEKGRGEQNIRELEGERRRTRKDVSLYWEALWN